MKSIEVKAGILIFVSVLTTTFIFYGYQAAFTANILVNKKNDVSLYIPTGSTFEAVIDSMDRHDMIHDRVSFLFLCRMLGYRENVKPGHYLIKTNSSNKTVLQMLRGGHQTPVKVTINNVRLKEDFIKKIDESLELKSEDLTQILNDNTRARKYGFDTTTVMCMFIPNTYEFYWTTGAEEFVNKMQSEYKKFWTMERIKKAEQLGLTPEKAVILASIVEAETGKNDEKPKIAGVYLNRLNAGQALQADPTVKFAIRDFALKRIRSKHTAADSPYNTYRYKGLPPGPINLPSMPSIDAVLNYEKHDYYYFCAKQDFSGYHSFAADFDGHLENARNYQKALNARNIK